LHTRGINTRRVEVGRGYFVGKRSFCRMEKYILGQQLVNGIVLGCTYGLIAVGYTMVYGIIGMINFAHGEVYMIAAYLAAIILAVLTFLGVNSAFFSLILTLFGTILLTSVYGWTIEKVAYKPLRNSPRLAPLISAIGMSLVLQNYVQINQGAGNQGIPAIVSGAIRVGDAEQFFQITYLQGLIVLAAIISMTILSLVIRKTTLGRACRATQQDPTMAAIIGIDTNRIISTVFIIGASMAGVAGVLVTMNYGSFDFFVGFVTGIKAFTAAVMGGIGSLTGAMLGGLLLGLSESLFSGYVNTDYKDVFAFSLLVFILIFRPSGLLGRPETEKV